MSAGVRVKTSRAASHQAVVFVDDVRVRFRRSLTGDQWRCDRCGAHRFATCNHERTAIAALREHLDKKGQP